MACPQPPEASVGQPDESFPKRHRLLRRSSYLRVQKEGGRVHTPHFVMLLLPAAERRLGVTVGKRIGCAVQRNRVKRLVREVFRRNQELFPADFDVVLVARAGAPRLDYEAVRAELERAQGSVQRLLSRATERAQERDTRP